MDIGTILVVDDEQLVRDTVADMLEGQAEKVITVQSGEEALRKLTEEKVTAVVTDVKMPGMDGLELVERIKSMDDSIPVVVMTGYSELFTMEEAMKKGADEYIMKPFRRDELSRLIASAQLRAASMHKRRVVEEKASILEYIKVANKIIASSGYPSPHKENLLSLGEKIKQSIINDLRRIHEQTGNGHNGHGKDDMN